MFREQLHKDIDRITPSPELLDKISLMMREQVQKPKPRIFMNAVRYGGMAAAICLVSAAVIIFGIDGGVKTSSVNQSPLSGGRSADSGQTTAETAALQPAAFGAYEATTTAEAVIPYAETEAEAPLVSGAAYGITEAKVSTESSLGDLYNITPPCPVYTGTAGTADKDFTISNADTLYYSIDGIAKRIKDGSLSVLSLTINSRLSKEEFSEIDGVSKIANNSVMPISCYKITINKGWGNMFVSGTDASIPAIAVFYGDESSQYHENPFYSDGDRILCTAEISNEGIILISECFLCDIYDSVIDEETGETAPCAYLRIHSRDDLLDAFPNSLVEYSVPTTTDENNAVYYQAFALEALTEYLDSVL